MEIQKVVSDLKSEGTFKEIEVTINASAHAFATVSKNLYSDPYKAIVRELCCNAMDSHIVAGTTDIPFELILPNHLSPIFKVRDYGTGMSRETMETVYSSVFTSSKQSDNRQTGCFGLGSKSPYAYTQKFTTISYYQGMCYHYANIIDEWGKLRIIEMGQNETTEPNGLEVSFEVQKQHFFEFESAARTVLRPFAIKPVVRGCGEFKPYAYEGKTLFEGPGWNVRSKAHGSSYIVMGNVEYPIEQGRQAFSAHARRLLLLPIVVEFPLGAFEMTPSRESIQWTEYSAKSINDRFEVVYEELFSQLDKKFENAKTAWEASLIYDEVVTKTPIRQIAYKPIWNGAEITNIRDVPKNIKVTSFVAGSVRKGDAKNSCVQSNSTHIKTEREVVLYLADFPGAKYRLANLVRDTFTRSEHCYLIDAAPEPANWVSPDTRSFREVALAEFCEEMGFELDVLKPASSIPKRARTVSTTPRVSHRSALYGSKSREFLFKMEGKKYDNSSEYWKEGEVDLSQPGFYVEIDRWAPLDFLGKPGEVERVISAAKCLGFLAEDAVLVGVKTKHKDAFEKRNAAAGSHFQLIGPYLQGKVKALWNSNKDLRLAYAYFTEYSNRDERQFVESLTSFVKEIKDSHQVNPNSFIVKFVEVLNTHLASKKNTVNWFSTCKKVLEGQAPLEYEFEYLNVEGRIAERYPLLADVLTLSYSWQRRDSMFKHLVEYIEMRDLKVEANKESK